MFFERTEVQMEKRKEISNRYEKKESEVKVCENVKFWLCEIYVLVLFFFFGFCFG